MSSFPSLQLPDFFNDHMVLQREKPIRVFGLARPGSVISAELGGAHRSVKTKTTGEWEVELPPQPAGGPHTLLVRCGRLRRTIKDVLVGDLWFCSGQSNMHFQVNRSLRSASVIKKAILPEIRHFQVENIAADLPSSTVKGEWKVCNPSTVGEFTAVGYYFAREIHTRVKVPIGIVHSSWGGTPIEAWLPPSTYRKEASLKPVLEMEKKLRRPGGVLKAMFKKWEQEQLSRDPGNKGEALGWALPEYDDRKWGKLKVPGFWEGQGLAIDGAVWFRHRVRIPPAWRGLDLKWDLGPIDDFDISYFNGKKVGSTGKEVENPHRVHRSYCIPGELVQTEEIVLAVRIFDQFGSGGFVGQKEMLRLSCPSRPSDAPTAISGHWRYRIEWSVDKPSPVPQPPALPEPRARLSRLYNGMVHGLRRVPIRGFLWYQGESNANRAAHYRCAFPALIQAWRDAWRDSDIPFYYVQLANFKSRPNVPGDDCWAELREAQAAALSIRKTGMAVAIDAGEVSDIHPRDKQKVGRRLARFALARDYGRNIQTEGPTPCGVSFEGERSVIEFDNVGEGLSLSKGIEPAGFALAGNDRRWVWARAKIRGKNRVLVISKEISKPVALRYGWATNAECNLQNSDGLPAAPFRTDDWALTTQGNLWPV